MVAQRLARWESNVANRRSILERLWLHLRMKRLLPLIVSVGMATVAMAHAPNERAELESVYKAMSRAFATKDVKLYTSFWTPAIRWFPPKSISTTTLTRDRADLTHDLRVEFSKKDRVTEDFALVRVDADKERATVELAVSITHLNGAVSSKTVSSQRHHWLKAGGRWWLSRIEALS